MIQTTILALFALCLTLSCACFSADEKEKTCKFPKDGPAWLQDFSPAQKKALDISWEAEKNTASITLDGTYPEEHEKDRSKYSEYSNETSLEAVENWKCGKDLESEFVNISGKMENELEWEMETPQEKQSYESEDQYVIKDINIVHHIEHESEKTTETDTPYLKKDYTEELEWVQRWDKSGKPVITGVFEAEGTEEHFLPSEKKADTRMLANTIIIPGFQPSKLLPGRKLVIETEKEGKLDGPIDPVLLKTKQTAKQWAGEKLIEEKEIHSKETRYYLYNPTKKEYDFLSLNELHTEKIKNLEKKMKVQYNKLETWSDLNRESDKTSFWKEIYQLSGIGASSTFTITSQGHDILPGLFDVKTKNGSFTRITDFNPRGKIIRFLVLYFPPHKKGNETKMDIKFDDNGNLAEFIVDDGINELETYEDPFNNPAAMYTLQSKITAVKKLEELAHQKSLPKHTIKPRDYPVVYKPVPKEKN